MLSIVVVLGLVVCFSGFMCIASGWFVAWLVGAYLPLFRLNLIYGLIPLLFRFILNRFFAGFVLFRLVLNSY